MLGSGPYVSSSLYAANTGGDAGLEQSAVLFHAEQTRRHLPASAVPTKVFVGGESHTHSSQHFPGTLTRLGMGQSGLGSRMFMEQSGTHPTAPSRQVHWYLQLLWNISPLLYTMPPITQVAPSWAVGVQGGGHGLARAPWTMACSEKLAVAHLCRRRCVYWWERRSHRKGLCVDRRRPSRCRALPSVWHTPCSSRSRRALDSLLGGTEAGWRGTNTGRCTPDPQPEHREANCGKYRAHFALHTEFCIYTLKTQCHCRLKVTKS